MSRFGLGPTDEEYWAIEDELEELERERKEEDEDATLYQD